MDAETFKRIFLPYSGNFYRVAYRMLENSKDAEDAVQDLFLKLWKIRDKLGDVRNIEAFAVAIIRNICIDKLRSSENKASKCSTESVAICQSDDIFRSTDNSDEIMKIKKAVLLLPENQRKVFKLKYFNDCTLKEIEKITGIGSVNIRVMLTRARRNIKEKLAGEEII